MTTRTDVSMIEEREGGSPRERRHIRRRRPPPGIPYSPRALTYLSGPRLADFYRNLAGKRILLLGEGHGVTEEWCHPGEDRNYVEVEQYLVDLAETAPECLDVMVETSYIKELGTEGRREAMTTALREKEEASQKMSLIESRFADCVSVGNCHGGLVRYHFMDIRHMAAPPGKESGSNFTWYLKYYFEEARRYDWRTPDVYDEAEYKKILMFLCGQEPGRNFREMIGFVEEQLKKLNLPEWEVQYVIDSATKGERAEEAVLLKEIGKMDKEIIPDTRFFFSKLCDAVIAYERDVIGGVQTDYISINTMRMDAYMIARLFVKFDESKMGRGPVGCRDARFSRIRNAILYTGAEHTFHYWNFFLQHFGKDPDVYADFFTTQSKESCLRFDPPFDYWR